MDQQQIPMSAVAGVLAAQMASLLAIIQVDAPDWALKVSAGGIALGLPGLVYLFVMLMPIPNAKEFFNKEDFQNQSIIQLFACTAWIGGLLTHIFGAAPVLIAGGVFASAAAAGMYGKKNS